MVLLLCLCRCSALLCFVVGSVDIAVVVVVVLFFVVGSVDIATVTAAATAAPTAASTAVPVGSDAVLF